MAYPNNVPGLADGIPPSHTYLSNHGYVTAVLAEAEVQSPEAESTNEAEDDVEEDYADIFQDDVELDEADLMASNPADLTKSYNRQRRFNEALSHPNTPKSQYPKSNSPKPAINTRASIDDNIASLSKHAGKLKLNDKQSGLAVSHKLGPEKSDRATSEQVLDPRTRMLLLQMINTDIVSEINGVISTGKEANVYHAFSNSQGGKGPLLHRAIKVYKTSILAFKDRAKYVEGEFRFRRKYNTNSNLGMVQVWAEKEFRNLKRIHISAIPCPEPIYLRLQVMAMSFVGDEKGNPAPRLKDVELEGGDAPARWRKIYITVVAYIRILYHVCRLVHGDLSEYNILLHKEVPWIIDVSQSVENDHPRGLEFLRMDIMNTSSFFQRKGVATLTDRKIFDFVIATEGKIDLELVKGEVGQLLANRKDGPLTAQEEVENAVFRKQFIPQTLYQVYDDDREMQQYKNGDGAAPVYMTLLADPIATKPENEESNMHENTNSATDGSTASEDESARDSAGPRTPRGKRFQDKEVKREHKKQVKEENREKRNGKMSKNVKKKLVSQSARHKH